MSSRIAEDALSLHDPDETVERMVRFLKTHTERIGAKNVIVGMSGGLDSSVTATLCAMAVGGQRTIGLCLPEEETKNSRNLKDAQDVAEKRGIRFRSLDISPLVQATKDLVHSSNRGSRIPMGNAKARLRAMILYYYANTTKGLVVGTGDKSEIMLGYFTKYGDGACDIQPIADLYKTTVRHLGKHLGLPLGIYSKPSSPDLWPGQTAEEELGLGYEKLDLVLWGLERWMEPREIGRDLGLAVRIVEGVKQRWLRAEQKRRPPLALKLGFRTSSQDLRLPYLL
ncbi:MAG TPA: NAD+ synthase [Candidatus Dormibacteraeota bacterium]|nr:NAD+ synthase [Candidatus Dormibacteraeota bacterium]